MQRQDGLLLIGDVADQIGCQVWRVRRLAERKLIPPPQMLGRIRVFRDEDVPAIRDAAIRAGYLKSPLGASA